MRIAWKMMGFSGENILLSNYVCMKSDGIAMYAHIGRWSSIHLHGDLYTDDRGFGWIC
jgi:hypothetical protein